MKIDPLLTGQLSAKVPGYFDEVYAAFAKNAGDGKVKYILRLTTIGFYKARSRLSGKQRVLPDELPNNYQALMAAIEKAKEKEGKLTV